MKWVKAVICGADLQQPLFYFIDNTNKFMAVYSKSKGEMKMLLEGKTVLILISDGYQEHEFWFPYYRFLEEGAEVIVAAPKAGTIYGEGRLGKDGLMAEANILISELPEKLPDILFLPGGMYSPMELRNIPAVQEYVKKCIDTGKLVCAIGHASWILVSAGVLNGRTVSCPNDISWDVTGVGAAFSQKAVTLDSNILTAEYFARLPEMFRMLFQEGIKVIL